MAALDRSAADWQYESTAPVGSGLRWLAGWLATATAIVTYLLVAAAAISALLQRSRRGTRLRRQPRHPRLAGRRRSGAR